MKLKGLFLGGCTGAALLMSAAASAEVKVGIILGFTGPIESLTPAMRDSALLAFEEASDSGNLLGGETIEAVTADSTCVDAAAASAATERLITSEGVVAIMGADCSGVTTAVANSVAVPNGVPMVSPSATSPALSTIDDKGLFFRTAPSDARQGEVLAQIVMGRGIGEVAITYTNNDYGKGLADSFAAAYEELGGKVAVTAAHEDGKGDYSAEVGALSASGAPMLAVFGYLDQGGRGIIQQSLDTGAFDSFVIGDGMVGDSLIENVQGDISGTFGTIAGSESDGAAKFLELAEAAGFDGSGPYGGESYDAAALIALAIQAGGKADRASVAANIMKVANAPGEKILPGELGRALEILAGGGDVDYVGATSVEFNDVGEASGTYRELEIKEGEFQTIQVH